MKKLIFILLLFSTGCMTAARKATQQAQFKAQWDLLTPDQQHQMYYEAFKDAYGVGKPVPQTVYYQQYPVYTPPHTAQTYCYPVGRSTYCNTY